MTGKLHGAFTAMVTPFSEDGKTLDEKALAGFIEWQISEGINGLVPCGTTGESPTLSPDEHDRVVAVTVEVAAGRVPVVAGTGSNSTAEAVARTRHAETNGADAAMLVTPYYNKPSQEGMIQHFEAVLDATEKIPIIIYNIPGRSIVDFQNESLRRLLHHPRLVGIKDATQDLVRPALLRQILAEEGRADDFSQFSGEDPTAVAFLAQGGHGCISVSANVAPAFCAEQQEKWRRGDISGAQSLDARLQPLHGAMFCSPSPGPAKYALSLGGRMTAAVRLPVSPPGEAERERIRAALSSL
ncbi:MAG: 4-hydroxy-tetrahydrodipicolinate synthase [Alphaproteobacteria bacterium]|nr:4-hydroxy-tetrahydrodipicolinate synthase [Alphaproteobacteria bacterium]MDA8004361.1 4-hydroxy-tetrahydrodipicolinate synthase [Alphaproteobacteria bacterium]MDA8006108.1 4-hydroxy-tetrahydrodipicolinate synthase [Alphaproteobacteria bacterium]MDA8013672.1 4-hydroxy-tetrahydrodipicolinate synthase [Alphaproteobacteria bacterium]